MGYKLNEWANDLMMCPSQCYYPCVDDKGAKYTLYLRWSWDDPWEATIIKGSSGDLNAEWVDVNIPEFTHDDYKQAQAALLDLWQKEYKHG